MSGLLILSRSDIARLMDYGDYVEALEATLRAEAQGQVVAPPALSMPVTGGSFHAKGAGLLGSDGLVAIKINGNFPNNPVATGLPTVQGLIYLADAGNGRPLAVMDSIEVTINRTGAATTLTARHLARPDPNIATICGAGVQGRIQLKAIAAVARLKRVFVWDIDFQAATRFAAEMSAACALDVQPSADLTPVRHSDIVVTCSSARQPFLTADLVRPGTFIAAVGADNESKQEIDPQLLAKAKVVTDLTEQASTIGDLHHALVAGAMRREDVHAELGEVVAGAKPGRTSDAQITIADLTGVGFQDTAIASRALACLASNC